MRRILACMLLAVGPLACSGKPTLDPTAMPKAQVIKAYEGTVEGLAFLPDGRQLVTVGRALMKGESKNLIKLWDLTSGKERGGWPVDLVATDLSISADGKTLALSDGGELILWDIPSGQGKHWKETDKTIQERTAAFSSDGKTLGVLEVESLVPIGNVRLSAKLKDLGSGSERPVEIQGRGLSEPHRFSPDLRYVTGLEHSSSPEAQSQLTVWDLTTGKPTVSLKDQPRRDDPQSGSINVFSRIAFSPDSERLVTGTSTRGLVVWESSTGKEVRRMKPLPQLTCFAFSPDGKTLAVGGMLRRYGAVKLCDASSGASQIGFAGSQQRLVGCLAISPDGKMLAFGDGKGVIHVCKLMDAADDQANQSFEKFGKEKQKAIQAFAESRKQALVDYRLDVFRKEPTKSAYEGIMAFEIGDSFFLVVYEKTEGDRWTYQEILPSPPIPVNQELLAVLK